MEDSQIIQIIAMLVLVGLSAIYAATEMAYTALNRSRLKNAQEKKARNADLSLKLLDDYDKLLSTILVANNIVNITLATVATVFFTQLNASAGATIATIVITVVVLIFGEISPKTIARECPENLQWVLRLLRSSQCCC